MPVAREIAVKRTAKALSVGSLLKKAPLSGVTNRIRDNSRQVCCSGL